MDVSKYFQNIADSLQNNISQGQANRILEEDPNMLGGIQSKSWIEPWIEDPNNLYIGYSFGNHAELLPTGQELHMWHAGVRNLMNNLIEVIGSENFLYSTGNAVYYTAKFPFCKQFPDIFVIFRETFYNYSL